MLRVLVVLLLIANAAFYAWSEGWLDSIVGMRAIGDREPERLARQVRPEIVRVVGADIARGPEPAPTIACLEAGPFTDAEAVGAQAAVQSVLPSGSWALVRIDQPGSWIVYMGRFPGREAQLRKEDELNRRKLSFQEVHGNAALEPGLSLGQFDDKGAANRLLDQLVQQGVRSARVVELSAAASTQVMRVAKADPALAAKLATLRSNALGKGFGACASG